MFFRQGLASLLHLFGVFSFFAAGSVSLCLFFSETARFKAIEALFAHPDGCLRAGLSLIGIGIVMILGFYALHRGRYLRFKIGKNRADVDVALIQRAVDLCLKNQFADKITLVGVAVRGNRRLEIEVQTEHQDLTLRLETELTTLLQRKFGVFSSFYLTVRSTAKVPRGRDGLAL